MFGPRLSTFWCACRQLFLHSISQIELKYNSSFRNTVKDFARTRKAFKEFSGSHLAVDYPEAIYEAWISFEESWGGQKELHDALIRVRKLGDALADKRARVSMSGSPQKLQLIYVHVQDAHRSARSQAPTHETQLPPTTQDIVQQNAIAFSSGTDDIVMADAEGSTSRTSIKRKADDEDGPNSKKLKAGTINLVVELVFYF